jgi:hypothetical protein
MKVWVNMVQNKTRFRVIPPDSGWANPARETSRGRFGSRDVSPQSTSFCKRGTGSVRVPSRPILDSLFLL